MKKRRSIKRTISYLLVTLLLAMMTMSVSPSTAVAAGTPYYVDSSAAPGGDGSLAAPWNSLDQVNAHVFVPGDSILLKAGSSFTGTLMPQGSGASGSPIIIDMYGTGAKPVITAGNVNKSSDYQDIASGVVGGHTYTFGGYGMLDVAGGSGTIKVVETYGAGSTVEHAIAGFTSTVWTYQQITFTTQPNVTALRVYVQKENGSGSFFLADDITLKDNAVLTELMDDPGFEKAAGYVAGPPSLWKEPDGLSMYQDQTSVLGYRTFAPRSGVVSAVLGVSAGVKLAEQQYYEINNLEIIDNAVNKGRRNGVFVSSNLANTNHIYVKNCYIHNLNDIPDSMFISAGIDFVGNGKYNDIIVDGCTIDNAVEGIDTMATGARSTNVIVRNNTVSNIKDDGILITNTSSAIVENNLCNTYNTMQAYGEGIWGCQNDNIKFQYNEVYNGGAYVHSSEDDGEAFNAGGDSTNTIYQYNYSHNNAGGFMLIDDSGFPNAGNTNAVVRYNISQNDQDRIFFFTSANPLNAKIYNNTFYIAAGTPYKVQVSSSGYPNMVYFYNNIFYDTGVSSGWSWGTMPEANRVFDYNCFYGGTGNPTQTHPITSDPLFLGAPPAGNGRAAAYVYKLQSTSPCKDAGARIGTDVLVGDSNGGVDYWGNNLYYNGSADVGASEYVGDAIVDFESRGTADQALTGIYPTGGIDWGTSDWRTAYYTGCTVYLYANNLSTAEITRTFTLPAGKVLKSLKIAGQPSVTNTVKVSQPGNTEITWTNIPNAYQTYNTGWTSATGSIVTVKITCTDPTLGASGIIFDDIVYGN